MKAQSRENTNAIVRRKVEKNRVYMYKTQTRKLSRLRLSGAKSVISSLRQAHAFLYYV